MDIKKLLANVHFLKSLSEEDLEKISSTLVKETFKAGETIIKENDIGDALYIIAEGEVEVGKEIIVDNSKEFVRLKNLFATEFFGEMALVDKEVRSASIIASTDVVTLRLNQEDFHKVCNNNPTVLLDLSKTITKRIRSSNENYTVLWNDLIKKNKMAAIGTAMSKIIHDLKSPLTTIILTAQLLENKYPALSKYTNRIEKQTTHAEELIMDILNFVKNEKETLNLQEIPIENFWFELEDTILPLTESKNIDLNINNHCFDKIKFDRLKMKRTFINIIKNAVEAIGKDGRIDITSVKRDNNWIITIEDDGPGIPEHIIDNIFEPFVTFGKKNGTGFGMAICEKTIKEHNGKIFVKNLKKGASFEIQIPIVG